MKMVCILPGSVHERLQPGPGTAGNPRLSLAHNLKTVALMWAFGLAVIGAPLTCIMLFIRGFALGFSSAFVIKQVAQGGFLIFAAGMLPHNLVALPALVLLSSLSLAFSVRLFSERPWVHGGCLQHRVYVSSPLCPSCCWPLCCWKHTSHLALEKSRAYLDSGLPE